MSFTDYFTRRTEFDIFPLEEADLLAAAVPMELRRSKDFVDALAPVAA